MPKENNNKTLNIIKKIAFWLIVAVTVFIMIFTIVSVTMFDQNDRNLLGFKFFVVQTDSMAATDFDAGDIIISKNVDVTTLREGDIITFISQDPDNYGETVTHKIREVTTDTDGSRAFVTYGTTTNTDDRTLATIVIGKYIGRIPNMGAFFLFLKTTPGYILCVLVPFLILILIQAIDCINLFRKYKKEQLAKIEAEREKLEAERAESQRMMLELMELKAQLAKQNEATQTSPEEPKNQE